MSKRKTKPKPPPKLRDQIRAMSRRKKAKPNPTLLEQIRDHYVESGMRPVDLKDQAGLAYQTAWRYHHDDRKPDAETLNLVFAALGLEVVKR